MTAAFALSLDGLYEAFVVIRQPVERQNYFPVHLFRCSPKRTPNDEV